LKTWQFSFSLAVRPHPPRRVCRPQVANKIKIILSGGYADRKDTYRLASVSFSREARKACAQSRRNPLSPKATAFGEHKKVRPKPDGLFCVFYSAT